MNDGKTKNNIKSKNDKIDMTKNYDVCPRCKTNKVNWGNPESIDDNLIIRQHNCFDCNFSWDEEFYFKQIVKNEI